jgi:hypothetical protein
MGNRAFAGQPLFPSPGGLPEMQGGDERAFRTLHTLWRADVGRMARVAVEDPNGAREVAPDAWIAVATSLGRAVSLCHDLHFLHEGLVLAQDAQQSRPPRN